MKRVQWAIVGSLVTGLFAIPAFADQHQGQPQQQQQTQQQEQPIQGKAEMTEIGLGQTPPLVRAAIENWAKGSEVKRCKRPAKGPRSNMWRKSNAKARTSRCS
jgi:hypothetical protein